MLGARARVRILAVSALGSVGCGGGSPLLHPARTLPSGEVRAAGGISAHVVPGGLGNDLRRAREIATENAGPPASSAQEAEYAKGALVAAAISPGLAPFVSARVGVGNRFEGGLAYTGRAARVDMRRSFDDGPWSLSLGLGASATLYGRQQGSDLPNVDLGSIQGYGADVPVLGGWQSDGGIYTLWFGGRGGFELLSVERVTTEPKDVSLGAPPTSLTARRFYGGGVFGLATGFRHVHVAIELAAAYQSVSGTYAGKDATVSGFTLTPASAIWWTF